VCVCVCLYGKAVRAVSSLGFVYVMLSIDYAEGPGDFYPLTCFSKKET